MRVRFADINGVRTRYYESGDGPAVVMIHGAGAASDTWSRNIETLDARGAIYAPDLIGHGFADAIDMTDRIPQEAQLEHIKQFCAALSLRDVVLVGSAFGALIAALAYIDNPSFVRGLVLVGSASVFHPPSGQAGMIKDAIANQSSALSNPTRGAIRKRNVGSNYNKDDIFDEIILTQMTAFALPGRLETYQWMTEGMRATSNMPEWRVQHRLESLDTPTLVISGKDDPRANWEITAEQARRLPDAEVHLFERCGHKPFSEQAERFNSVVGAFLDQLR